MSHSWGFTAMGSRYDEGWGRTGGKRVPRREKNAQADQLFRFASYLFLGRTPLQAYLLSDFEMDRAPGELDEEEQGEFARKADAIARDPRVVAHLEMLRQPGVQTLQQGAKILATNQVRRGLASTSERVSVLAGQDVMNRGNLPATTVQRLEGGTEGLEKLSPEELRDFVDDLMKSIPGGGTHG